MHFLLNAPMIQKEACCTKLAQLTVETRSKSIKMN
jgi:hypothetical protein